MGFNKLNLIAHRGLIKGPSKTLENQPQNLRATLEQGYDCEIDLWVFDDRLYLGHDGPQFNVTQAFIENPKFWIHAKNLEALRWLTDTELNYFWHENDKFTLTSKGFIWAFPEQDLTNKSIRLMPEWADPELTTVKESVCYGVCSDYILKINELLSG
jgi:hypothetical protein